MMLPSFMSAGLVVSWYLCGGHVVLFVLPAHFRFGGRREYLPRSDQEERYRCAGHDRGAHHARGDPALPVSSSLSTRTRSSSRSFLTPGRASARRSVRSCCSRSIGSVRTCQARLQACSRARSALWCGMNLSSRWAASSVSTSCSRALPELDRDRYRLQAHSGAFERDHRRVRFLSEGRLLT